MKVACLFADRAFERKGQDMLLDSMFAGCVNAFGSTNVRHFPDDHPQFLGRDDFMTDWPFWLGAGCLRGKPRATFPLDKADVYLVNVRWILNAVEDGLFTEDAQRELIKQVDPAKTILIDSSDSPSWLRIVTATQMLDGSTTPGTFPACAHRPGIVNDTAVGDEEALEVAVRVIRRSRTVHISVPLQHIHRAMAKSNHGYAVFAALNDNGSYRRAIMHALDAETMGLHWGSGSGYEIPGTRPPIEQSKYYSTIRWSLACVAARGAGIDCLRETEILALGSLLITQDPGWGYGLKSGENCLIYETPDQCVEHCRWSIEHPRTAREIAREGQRLYMEHASPEQQVVRLIRKAGLLRE